MMSSLHSKLFPPFTLRRFIWDQTISWIFYWGYYATIIIPSTTAILGLFYIVGHYLEPQKDNVVAKMATGYCVTTMMVISIGIIIVTIWLIIISIHKYDYLPWKESQQKIIKDVTIGTYDEESVINIPVKLNAFGRTIHVVLPLGSIRRYFVRGTLMVSALAIILVIYSFASIWFFHFVSGCPRVPLFQATPKCCSWPLSLIISVSCQFVLFAICFGTYSIFSESCSKAWKKHVAHKSSAVSHKGT